MDWYLPNDHAAASVLRQEISSFLARHAAPGADIAGAELAVSELLTNAVKHTDGDVWVSIDWGAKHPVLTVQDLGDGLDLDEALGERDGLSVGGYGLMIATSMTKELEVAARAAGGSRVTATLDVARGESIDHDYGTDAESRLPVESEAVDGAFGRESFLRALVVELADGLEMHHGPHAAEAAVARIGAAVGGSMERVHRTHHRLSGPLSSERMAELYVDLKKAIDGDFYVVAIEPDRIVLGNRRCPFGDAVRHAPSLCRMTSSVFGGIAARNTGREVAVHLEERIAVGDQECRVTVWLDEPPAEILPFVHRYTPPATTGDEAS